MRAQAQLAWAASVAVGGLAAFKAVRELPSMHRSTVALGIVAIALAVLPSASEFGRIDHCLDSGGRWNYEGLHCER